jgi:hypothetical protein
MAELWIDHVVYVVDDLERGAAEFIDRFGLSAVGGGRHPGWGTANRIVPLGREYIELVAAVDRDEADTSEFGRAVMTAGAAGRRLAGWAVATDDLDGVARRLDLEITRGARTRPDGSRLSWRLAGVSRALSTGALPFFIQWDVPPEAHPGAIAAPHRAQPRGIAWLEVTAAPESLAEWLGDHDLPVRLTDGPPSLSAVGVATAAGELRLL